ncbi:MAG: UDP-3-O-(3-hydroxymyristoyl)glucosamine N-acyltransferase [Phycisphaerae bacterium]
MTGTTPTTAAAIADYLRLDLIGEDLPVRRPCALDRLEPGCITFASRATPEALWKISGCPDAVVICPESLAYSFDGSRIVSDTPRVSFIKVVSHFFAEQTERRIHPTAVVSPQARIGIDVAVGPHACIGPQVTIGDRTVIGSGVAIEGQTVIGSDCFIKANSVIGGPGFGFDLDDDGTPLHFPHLGGVHIGDSVWIGANTTIERAALDQTVVQDHVKIDDHVQIGHNTRVGRNTRICAGTILCGRARIEPDSWVSPKVTVIQGKTVGPRSIVGISANVLTDVPPDTVYAGNPARHIRDIEPGQFTKLLTVG